MRVFRISVAVAASIVAGCSYDIATPDCGFVLTPTDEAICASPALRKLDRALAKQYQVALSISGDAEPNLRAEHAAWIAQRNACGGDGTCIAKRYRERLNVLADYD